MKRLSFLSLATIALVILQSCGGNAPVVDHSAEVDLGKFDGNKYSCKEIGWSIEYPESWNITGKESLENLDKQSRAAAGLPENQKSPVKRLLAFQKNFNNNFQSTVEPFSGKTDADYQIAKANLRYSLYDSYYKAGTRVDTSATQLKVGQISFDCFQLNLYDNKGKAYAHQLLYSAIVKDYYFTAIVSYDNDKDKNTMLEAFKKSKFN